MSYFKKGKDALILLYLFVGFVYAMFFSFIADLTVYFFGKALAIVTCILNPLQHLPTWIACTNNLIQVFWVQCMTIIFDFRDVISINKDLIYQWSCIWTDQKVVIIISKEMRTLFKSCVFYFKCFQGISNNLFSSCLR